MARQMTEEQKQKMQEARKAKAAAKAAADTGAEETKADKFKRLATKRVNKAIKALSAVGNLAGSGYESTPEQKAKVVNALMGAAERVKEDFNKSAGETAPSFTV